MNLHRREYVKFHVNSLKFVRNCELQQEDTWLQTNMHWVLPCGYSPVNRNRCLTPVSSDSSVKPQDERITESYLLHKVSSELNASRTDFSATLMEYYEAFRILILKVTCSLEV